MEEGSFCRDQQVLDLMYWLGQWRTVNAGLVVCTCGIRSGRGMLPNKDGEADNDRMNMN